MTCPEPGLWRAWLDREPSVPPAQLDRHLADCSTCRDTVAELRHDAELAVAAVGSLAPTSLPTAAATALARERLAWRQRPARTDIATPTPEHRDMAITTTFQHWRLTLAGLAAALALTFFIATPQGQAAAAQFLAQFRSQRFEPVSLDPAQAQNSLAALERLGTVQGGPPSPKSAQEVKNVDEASQRVGFPLKQPDPAMIPGNLGKTPRIAVIPAYEARFTFDRAKARAYLDSIGRSNVSLPTKFDGASLVVAVPAGALLHYTGPDNSIGLIVGQSRELTAGAEGNVSLDELRDFLLGLPGLPDDAVRQLRAMRDWKTTLPIPVPSSRVSWQQTTIAGGQALLLADTGGLGTAVIWNRDGRVYGLAGTVKQDVLERVANSLR